MIAKITIANKINNAICSSGAIAFRIDDMTTCKPYKWNGLICMQAFTFLTNSYSLGTPEINFKGLNTRMDFKILKFKLFGPTGSLVMILKCLFDLFERKFKPFFSNDPPTL